MEGKKDQIVYDDFQKVELKVGRVLTCERVPKSKKLIKMNVDVGEAEPRQIVAGIGPFYTDSEMIGRRVVVVANLAPATLMGFESQGMLLAASTAAGQAVLVGVPEGVEPGAGIS